MADAQQHRGGAQVLHQRLDVRRTLGLLRGVGQRHQVEHLGDVLCDLVAQRALDAARHLLLHLDGKAEQLDAGAVDGQIGVQGHGSKDQRIKREICGRLWLGPHSS
jgi:hypothetical protein